MITGADSPGDGAIGFWLEVYGSSVIGAYCLNPFRDSGNLEVSRPLTNWASRTRTGVQVIIIIIWWLVCCKNFRFSFTRFLWYMSDEIEQSCRIIYAISLSWISQCHFCFRRFIVDWRLVIPVVAMTFVDVQHLPLCDNLLGVQRLVYRHFIDLRTEGGNSFTEDNWDEDDLTVKPCIW